MKINKNIKVVVLCLLQYLIIGGTAVAEEQTNASGVNETSSEIGLFQAKNWGSGYSNYMNGPTFSEANGSSINHYLSLSYKMGDQWSLAGVFRPDSNFGNGKKSFTLGDSYLKLSYPKFYNDGTTQVYGDFRYYAPTSEGSKEAKLYGSLVSRIYISSSVGRLDLLYILIPKYYLNSEIKAGQNTFSHGHYLSSSLKMSPFWSIDFAVNPGWDYARGMDPVFNELPAYPGVTMMFNSKLSFSPYVEIPLLDATLANSSVGAVLSYSIF